MFLCCMLISLGLFTYPAHAEESKDHKFEDIKVAYLVNFMRLTVWPDLNQENPDKPLQITVISDKDFYQLLASAFPKSKFQDRKVNITHWRKLDLQENQLSKESTQIIKQSHLVYLSHGSLSDLQTIQKVSARPSYLLIGDMPKFAEYGGMIGLEKRQSGIAFTVNIKAIRQADLFISSKVLRLGTPVTPIDSP